VKDRYRNDAIFNFKQLGALDFVDFVALTETEISHWMKKLVDTCVCI